MNKKTLIIIVGVIAVLFVVIIVLSILFSEEEQQQASSSSLPVITPSSTTSSTPARNFNAQDISKAIVKLADYEDATQEDIDEIAGVLEGRLNEDWEAEKDTLTVQEAYFNQEEDYGYAQIKNDKTNSVYLFSKNNGTWQLTREISETSMAPVVEPTSSNTSPSEGNSSDSSGSSSNTSSTAPSSLPKTDYDLSSQNTWSVISNYSDRIFDVDNVVPFVDTENLEKYMSTENAANILTGVNGFLAEYDIAPITETGLILETSSVTTDEANRPVYKVLVSHSGGQSVFVCTCVEEGVFLDLYTPDADAQQDTKDSKDEEV